MIGCDYQEKQPKSLKSILKKVAKASLVKVAVESITA